MTIIEHVPTLETCQKLKEAGFPQETEFRWYESQNSDLQVTNDSLNNGEAGAVCAAPILTEILGQLPSRIPVYSQAPLMMMKSPKTYIFSYYHDGHASEAKQSRNPAEAAALLWLTLARR